MGCKTGNKIYVSPEEMKLEEVTDNYVIKTNYFVEYLSWNKGVLNAFLYHNKNTFVLNDEYETRKEIRDKLFRKYYTDDFIWSNQSYTSLASCLFKQMCGCLSESQYNDQTREILDANYPRALQWCSTGKQPKNLTNADINKCYPSILLNNEHQIPVYTIHDIIVPYSFKNDLRKCGKFYID